MQEAYGGANPARERASDLADASTTEPVAAPAVMDPSHPTAYHRQADTCPFFKADHGGLIGPPLEAPDEDNRCVATGTPQPQSARQQEFVCLTAGHANCPLFHQALVARRKAVARPPVERGPSPPVIAAALTLVAAAAASVGFLLFRGGLTMPVASVPPASVPVDSPAPASQVAVISSPSSTATLTITIPPATLTPTPSATATPTPSPTATPLPTATPATTPPPTSDRYALLKPCPDKPDCWIYTVRSGDNLRSIANYFGIPYPTVLDWNPRIKDPTTIRAGDKIRMPPPTR